MDDQKDGLDNDAAESVDEAELDNRQAEAALILKTGGTMGSRAGALAFLALVVVIGGAVYFHFSQSGAGAFVNRLDAEILGHTELSLAAMENGGKLAVAPSWPIALYDRLHEDIIFYAALAALAAWLWSLAARARARRDAFVIHERLEAEVAELRERLERLETGRGSDEAHLGRNLDEKA